MSLPESEACYQALLSRDARFDGRFYVAVSSTGIYCRPVCRVRTPRPENCRYFPSAAAAEVAGYRPCLRCRPEQAPGLSPVDASSRLAHAAVALIEARLGEGWQVERLAARIGVTPRHLRRLFQGTFGVSPSAYLASRRLQVARQLLIHSTLPITDVAQAAGFGSVRSFNARFLACYRQAPGSLRRARTPPDGSAVFRLPVRQPYDWSAMAGFLARRAIPGVEAVVGEAGGAVYRRVMRVGGGDTPEVIGWVEVAMVADALSVRMAPTLLSALPSALGRVRQLFDVDCDPTEVAARLGALACARPGLRLPGAVDGFEMSVRAILGQQVSVAAARTLATRVAGQLGGSVQTPWPALTRAFPTAAHLAAQTIETLRGLGIMPSRARAILALAQAVCDRRLVLEAHAAIDDTRATLLELPGVGPWTAEYILMRALSWPDAFPPGDVGVHRALGLARRSDVVHEMAAWRPWRAYAVMHLWQQLEENDGKGREGGLG